MSKRLCCFIPNQETLEQCQELAEYEIWMGPFPTPDDYTDSCAKHLSEMLDDNFVQFKIYRILGGICSDCSSPLNENHECTGLIRTIEDMDRSEKQHGLTLDEIKNKYFPNISLDELEERKPIKRK